VEAEPPACDTFSIRYTFLPEGQADYTGIANSYRDYLIAEKGMQPFQEGTSPFYLEVNGGLMRSVLTLGIPVNRVVPFTTYEQAGEIARQLDALGVENIYMLYKNWDKGCSVLDINSDLKPEGKLGGQKGLEQLAQTLEGIGARLSVDVNLLEMNKARWGYGLRASSIRTLSRVPLLVHTFLPSSLQPDVEIEKIYLLKPSRVNAEADKAARNFTKLNVHSMFPATLGVRLYSDYGEGGYDRTGTEDAWEEALGTLSAAAPLVLSAPNAYAIPYAADIVDAPVGSSNLLISDYSVPLYQIALRGLASVSVPSVNYLSSDARRVMLRALETGSALKITLNRDNISQLSHTGYDYLSGTSADMWLNEAAVLYKEAAPLLNRVAGRAILRHAVMADNVTLTVFEGGTAVLVNASERDVTFRGCTVPSMDWVTWEEGTVS
jgi:hypothetical protein